MTILPLDPSLSPSSEGLRDFLNGCQAAAAEAGHGLLVSISIQVDALDPLAVVESIFEPDERHFYVERPSEDFAIAGAEAVLFFSAAGPERFKACQGFMDRTLAGAVAIGDLEAPFSGPHFFASFSFLESVGKDEPLPAALVFVPRWQVARFHGRTIAVANLWIDASTQVGAVSEKIWRAHSKFRSFDYRHTEFEPTQAPDRTTIGEVGGPYSKAVGEAMEMISQGRLEKIVLARAKDLDASQVFHPLLVLNVLRQRFSDCYAFSLANGKGQSFIGASPERLLKVEGRTARTEALAGSARRGATASEDAVLAGGLLKSEKDLREHRFVIDSILARLAPLGLSLSVPGKPSVKRFANVQHLHTPIEAELKDSIRLLDLLERLHPTPAVGGTPREAAIEKIPSLEGFARGLYAGALGWIDSRGNGEFFVGLRSALIDGKRARLYAGAGIVAGSSPEKEFAETELKFKAMQEALLSS